VFAILGTLQQNCLYKFQLSEAAHRDVQKVFRLYGVSIFRNYLFEVIEHCRGRGKTLHLWSNTI